MAKRKGRKVVTLTSSHLQLLQVGFASALVLVAIYGSPSLAMRFSQLPIKGFVNEVVAEISVIDNPQALPGAMAAPQTSQAPSEPDLELLDELFVPTTPVVDDSALKAAAIEDQIKAQLSAVQVSAIATGGAFINGRFIKSGQPIGMLVMGPEGAPLQVMASVRGNTVMLAAGEFTHAVELR
jgi:hypothetical protein